MDARTAAPGGLALVEDFLRTRNTVTVADLTRWMQEHAIAGRAGSETLERAVPLREALRALMYANNGGPVDRDALSVVNDEIDACGIAPCVALGDDGAWVGWQTPRPARQAGGPHGLMPAVLAAVLTSIADGTWHRMKACAADDCRYAFFDHTKNHSGRWCDVSGCGVRARMRAYRRRLGDLPAG
jgi:predicted RNA-binding Zn ribbon-like protein